MEQDQPQIVLAAAPGAAGYVAKPRRRRSREGGAPAQQSLLEHPPALLTPYILPPPHPAPLPVFHPLGSYGGHPFLPYPVPLAVAAPGYFPHYIPLQEESESVRQVSLSPPVPDEIIVREVMEEMLGNMIPDLTRVIVNETISDFIISVIGQQWPEESILPRPPAKPPITYPTKHRPPVVYLQPNETVMVEQSNTRPSLLQSFHEQILHSEPDSKLGQALTTMLVDQITFQLLLTSDLDGGVTMATRTTSKSMITDMMFHHLLTRVVSLST